MSEQNWHLGETYKSLITISVEAFKFCALVNGGAVVAILAYLGNISGKDLALPDIWGSLISFCLGLAMCGLALVCSYVTQLKLYGEERDGVPHSERKHSIFLHFAIGLVLASIVFFVIGSFLGARAL